MRGGGWAVVGTADQPTVGQEELLEEAIGHTFWPQNKPQQRGYAERAIIRLPGRIWRLRPLYPVDDRVFQGKVARFPFPT